LCIFRIDYVYLWLYSIYLINTQFRFELNQYAISLQIDSKRKFIQLQNVPKYAAYSRLLQAITLFNHLPHHLSQLACPRQSLGHLLLVADQNSMSSRSSSTWNGCTPAHSNHFFYRTITFDFVPCHMRFCFLLLITLLFVQLNLILRHIYIEKSVIKP